MISERITDKQGISLITLYIIGSSLVLATGADAGKDAWLSIIISILISFPILMIYAKILYNFNDKNLFEINTIVFGKIIGKLINILYIWFSIHLGALVLRNFGEFIITNSLVETPIIITIISFSILCIWIVKDGIEVMGRYGEITIIFLLIFISFAIFLMIPIEDIENLRPILGKGFKPIVKASFSVFTFPFGETVVFMLIFTNLANRKSPFKIYSISLFIGGFIIFITTLNEILVLGESKFTSLFFPSYTAVGRVNIGDFIQRVEIIVGISFIGGGLIKISACLLAASKGFSNIFNIEDYRFIVTPIMALMVILSYIVYDSVNEMFSWAIKVWNYYSLPFEIILPIIILIASEIYIRKKKAIK